MSTTETEVTVTNSDENPPPESTNEVDAAVNAALAENSAEEAEEAAENAESAENAAEDSAEEAEESAEEAEEAAEEAEEAAEVAVAAATVSVEMVEEMRAEIRALPERLAEVLAAKESVSSPPSVTEDEIVPGEAPKKKRRSLAEWWYSLP